MSKQTPPQQNTSSSDLDPATVEHYRILQRQRERANRLLLKKRRAKSGQ